MRESLWRFWKRQDLTAQVSFGFVFMIAIPLGSPGVISAMVLGFLEYWNLIRQAYGISEDKKELWPLSLYLPNIDMDHAGTAFAASMVAPDSGCTGVFCRAGLSGAGNCLYGCEKNKNGKGRLEIDMKKKLIGAAGMYFAVMLILLYYQERRIL